MSVIGPRPALWNQDVLIAEREKYNANDVKPGLTGWAQINGRDELEIPVKAKLDGEYVEKLGILMDSQLELQMYETQREDTGGNVMQKKKRGFYYKLPMFLRARIYYWYRYYGQLGFLDGKEGNPSMTRFIMSLEEAVDLVLFAFENGTSGDILVQKAPACTIEVLAKAVTELFAPGHEIKVIGIRHGEKMYETLLTNEECANAIDMGEFYRVPCDKRDLNYDKYFKEGDVERNILTEFNSSNTELLDVEQVKEKLLTLQYIRDELAEWENL